MKNYLENIEKIRDCGKIKFDVNSSAQKQSLVLALIGDSVHALYLRTRLAKTSDLNAHDITIIVNKLVNASSQARAFRLIESTLTEEEESVAKHARNTHTHSTAKNYSVIDYRYATAFEALLGFLYLNKNEARINKILDETIQDFIKNSKN